MMMFIPSTATRASVTVTVTVCVLMPLVNTLSLSLGVVNNNNDSDDNDSNNDSVAVNRNTNRNSSAVDKVSHVAVLALCVVIVCWSVLVEWIMATSIEQTTSAENEPVNDVGDGEDTEVDDDDDVDIENSGNKVINLNNNIMPRPWTQVIADDVLLVKEKRGSNNTHDNKKGIAKDNRNNKTSNSNSNLDLIYPHFNNMARSAPAKLSAAFKVHNQID